MKNILFLILLVTTAQIATSQTRGYGNIDTADLKLNTCSFEKDANAMVLFDRVRVVFSLMGTLTMERHKRVKIFNEKAKDAGNVRIEYDNMYGVDHVYDIEAQTINLEKGKIVITKVDPKQIYAEHTDRTKDALVISFPAVKPGSVIEYRYVMARSIATNFPAWYFQSDLPTRYSEMDAFFNSRLQFKALTRVVRPFSKDTLLIGGHIWAASEMPSTKDEAYMRAPGDAKQSVSLLLTAIQDYDGKMIQLNDTWESIGKKLTNEKEYFKELDQHLSDEDTLVKHAQSLKSTEAKIAYVYNTVKSTIGWNGFTSWGSKDGIKNAWKKRVGNSAEVNAILYHLLKKSGVEAYPMLVSTRDNGLIEPEFVDRFMINKLVTYVPTPDDNYYILDATDRFNTYNQVPFELLNSYGLMLDKDKGNNKMVFIECKNNARETILINADLSPEAKMKGTAQIASFAYDRTKELELYKRSGDEKFKEYLTGGNNVLKITNLKLENMQTDTLPLLQSFDFSDDLTSTDNYIFFSPNIFTPMHTNPFLSETRSGLIDFGYGNRRVIAANYKLPAGYAVESIPKNITLIMPDKSIKFRRTLQVEENGNLALRYEIDVTRSRYSKGEYPDLREFYKRMYDMLDEQIVLKKAKAN